MNKCILQIWEESERGWGTRPGGCSLHITDKEHSLYYLIESVKAAHKRGAFTIGEVEIISKAIRTMSRQ